MSGPSISLRRLGTGFTLLELLTVMMILGILVAFAVPSFSYLAASTKLKTARTDLYIALLKARSEAIKRDAQVVLTPKNGRWENGWEIRTPTAAGTLLIDQKALPGVEITDFPASVTYLGSGRISTTLDRVRFNIRPKARNASEAVPATNARCVTVQANGSPYLKPEKDGGCT
ncbi:MAG TPA: GspH/FimT family pseudopilin [Verrucomicrobiae bacterium]|nr:GspH/FimT family pseudopilin [Verrucomicrobiae bacterium]